MPSQEAAARAVRGAPNHGSSPASRASTQGRSSASSGAVAQGGLTSQVTRYSVQLLLQHVDHHRKEADDLRRVLDEIDQMEVEVRERLGAAMHRGSQVDVGGARRAHRGVQMGKGADRLRSRLLLLRQRSAQRDALQARRDLEELARARNATERCIRDALTRAEGLVRLSERAEGSGA